MADFSIRGAGAVIRRHRMAKGWTLEVLANQAGTDKSQIAKYEANKVGLSDEKIVALATALALRPESLAYECLMEIKPHLKSKPIGNLLSSLVDFPVKRVKKTAK